MKHLNWLLAATLSLGIASNASASDNWPPVLVCVNQPDILDREAVRPEIWHPDARQPCFHSTRIPGMVFGPLVELDEGPTSRYVRATYYADRLIGFLPAVAGDASTPGVFLVHAIEFVRGGRRRLLFENSQFTGDGKEFASGWVSLDLRSGSTTREKLPGYFASDASVTVVQDRYAIYPTLTPKSRLERSPQDDDLYVGYVVYDLNAQILRRRVVTSNRPAGSCGGLESSVSVRKVRQHGSIHTRVALNLFGDCPEHVGADACARANLHEVVFR